MEGPWPTRPPVVRALVLSHKQKNVFVKNKTSTTPFLSKDLAKISAKSFLSYFKLFLTSFFQGVETNLYCYFRLKSYSDMLLFTAFISFLWPFIPVLALFQLVLDNEQI